MVLVDTVPGESYSSNLLRLAGKTAAPVVFVLTELQQDGVIDVRLVRPPDPFCASADGIDANINALRCEVDRILKKTGSSDSMHEVDAGRARRLSLPPAA